VALASQNATFADAKAACDEQANCSSFCFAAPGSVSKPTTPVAMMWKTSMAGFSPNPEIVGANAIMADCTYANVLADTLGLSPLTTDAQINSHLKVVLRENDSPYGFIVQTGRYPSIHDHGDNDNSLWMMANPDWATLAIWRGFDPNEALAVARKTLDWWRTELKDVWNVVAVGGGVNTSTAGQPLANSHYGYHMSTSISSPHDCHSILSISILDLLLFVFGLLFVFES
jgi:hypothetical protein